VTVSAATTAAITITSASGLRRWVGSRRGAISLGASNTIDPSVFHDPNSGATVTAFELSI
jgi:hypothetical protein